jgi:hypothetical protein
LVCLTFAVFERCSTSISMNNSIELRHLCSERNIWTDEKCLGIRSIAGQCLTWFQLSNVFIAKMAFQRWLVIALEVLISWYYARQSPFCLKRQSRKMIWINHWCEITNPHILIMTSYNSLCR